MYEHAGLVESGSDSYTHGVTLLVRDTVGTPDAPANERAYELQGPRASTTRMRAPGKRKAVP